jgi:hypothetical protein
MVFNIGSQHDGTFHNVAGDQVHGNQHVVAASAPAEIRAALREIRAGLDDLPPEVRRAAQAEVQQAEHALDQRQPDKPTVAAHLVRLTRLLSAAGALVTASTPLGPPLAAVAAWLGHLGDPVRRAL